jgi:CubicO group peptidase (beta-lactamase class C family)
VSQTIVGPPAVSRLLQQIERQWGEAKPSVYVASGEGECLVDWSLTPLPTPLTGITKLFTLSMVLREFDRGAFSPQTPISDLLSPDIVEGLCVVGGKDLSSQITVENLLAHQSGIADFYAQNSKGTTSFLRQSMERDRAWNLEQALEIAKHYPAKFAPGAKGKAHYSTTNYQLLGAILTQSTGMSFEQLISLRVTTPLGLKNTFVFSPAHYERYFSLTAVRWGTSSLRNPRTLASFGASGSVVSTGKETVEFMKAFWGGALFDPSWCEWVTHNPRSMGSGVLVSNGLMQLKSGFSRSPLLGHQGSSGAAVLMDPQSRNVGFLSLNTVVDTKVPLTTLGRVLRGLR